MIFQRSLKADVSRVSGIPFETLARMPYAEWAEVRATYCGQNNRLATRWLNRLAPVQPAEPSTLDRYDGARDLCMVLACTDTATTERHGWRTCEQHAPAKAFV